MVRFVKCKMRNKQKKNIYSEFIICLGICCDERPYIPCANYKIARYKRM